MNFLLSAFILAVSAFTTIVATPYLPLPAPAPSENIGGVVPLAPADFQTSLASPISSSATTMTLTANVIKGGSTFAGYSCFSIDSGSAQAEYMCGTIAGTTVSDMTRGIDPLTGDTSVASLKFAHRRGASVKVTDAPILSLVARILRGEETVDFTPTQGGNLATKDYVDSLALGTTTIPATYTDDGLGELATGAESASSTAVGQSGSPLLLHTSISTSTGGTAYTVPVTGSDGRIDDGFLPTTVSHGITFASATINSLYTASTTRIIFATSSFNNVPNSSYVASTTVPALWTGGMIKIHIPITGMTMSGADTFYFNVVYGGSSFAGSITGAEALSNARGSFEAMIFSATSTNSQTANFKTYAGFDSLDDASPATNASMSVGTSFLGADSSKPQSLTVVLEGLAGGDVMSIGIVTVEFIPILRY